MEREESDIETLQNTRKKIGVLPVFFFHFYDIISKECELYHGA